MITNLIKRLKNTLGDLRSCGATVIAAYLPTKCMEFRQLGEKVGELISEIEQRCLNLELENQRHRQSNRDMAHSLNTILHDRMQVNPQEICDECGQILDDWICYGFWDGKKLCFKCYDKDDILIR